MNLNKQVLAITTAGADGSAVGSGSIKLLGPKYVEAIKLDYSAGQPATTDVTITDPTTGTILSRANSATDGVFYPRTPAAKSADATASTLTEVRPVAEQVDVAVAEADGAETLTVTLFTADV